MPSVYQPSFAGGELSPSLYGRVDLSIYQSCLKTCTNFIPQAYGGIKNRQGTRFIRAAYSSSREIRLVPFTFNATQNYMLEIVGGLNSSGNYWDGAIRIISRGKYVSDSGGTPIVVAAPWKGLDADGNSVLRRLKFSQSADVMTVTHPDYQPFQIKRYSHSSWTCSPYSPRVGPWLDENTEKGTKMWCDKVEGSATVHCNLPKFTGKEKHRLLIRQKDFGQPWEVEKPIVVGDIRRSDGKYYRARTAGKTGTLRPIHDADTWSDGGVEWEYLHSGWGYGIIESVSSDGYTATMTIESRMPDNVAPTTTGGAALTITGAGRSSFDKIALTVPGHGVPVGATVPVSGTLYYRDPYNILQSVSFSGTNASAGSSSELELDLSWFVLQGFSTIDTENTSSLTLDASSVPGTATDTYKWAFSAWGGDNWPSCSGYFQQRHCFGGSPNQPQTVWMSRTSDYADFSESNPVADDDTVSFTVASAQIDGITSMLPMDKLVLFTLGGNWVLGGGQNDLITPANTPVKLQNYFGSSPLGPLGIGNAVLYHGRGGTVRDMAYDFASDSYVGNDLLVKADHMYRDKTMLEWAFQESPFPIIWTVRDDGKLVALTYLKEEKVVGWSVQDVGGVVSSVGVINECGEDHVYVVVTRNGSKYIEVLYGRVDDYYEACFVDSALTYDGRNASAAAFLTVTGATWTTGSVVTVTATGTGNTPFAATDVGDQVVLQSTNGSMYRINITAFNSSTVVQGTLAADFPVDLRAAATSSWGVARDTFTGLNHLEGQTVSVYKDGTYSTAVVSSYQVALSPPGLVTTIGLPIVATAETLSVVVPDGPGLEIRKLNPMARLLVENSRSTYVGQDTSSLQEIFVTSADDIMTNLPSGTGLMEAAIKGSWSFKGSFVIRHTKPYPLSILAVIPSFVGGQS